jgi:hypothetical protein
LILTLVAVCLGVFLLAPGLGVLLAVFAAPALVRTVIDASQYKRAGSQLSAGGKISSFLLSILVVLAAVMAACVAGGIVCAAGVTAAEASGAGGELMGPVVIAGALAALAVAGGLLWITRPRG